MFKSDGRNVHYKQWVLQQVQEMYIACDKADSYVVWGYFV